MSANLQGQHNAEMALQSLGEALNRDRERRLTARAPGRRHRRARRTRSRPPTGARRDAGMAQTLEDELRIAEAGAARGRAEAEARASRRQEAAPRRRRAREARRRPEARRRRSPPSRPARGVVMDPAKRKRLTDARAELDNLDRQLQAQDRRREPAARAGRRCIRRASRPRRCAKPSWPR